MSSTKKSKKKKYRPVAVETILPNAVVRPTTSWAEEVESELLSDYAIKKINNITLPTAPRAACDLVIDDSIIPPNGPFMAYLSNLPYDVTEEDLVNHFKELKILSIQLPKDDRQDRMKGFGYVEFKDKSNLIAALQEGELTLKGRYVRVSLPSDEEPNKDRGSRSGGTSFGRYRDSDRNDRSEKVLGEWRAGAPVPHDPDKSTSKHSVGFTRQQNRDRDGSGGGGFRDFKSGFQPADSGPTFSRTFRETRETLDRGSSGNRMFKRFDRDDRMGRSAFGSKKFDREDREMKREQVPEREEPKQRPKIEIQPRSIPLDANRTPESLPASIFGGAKPVDTAKREMEIEAKLNMASTAPSKTMGATPTRSTPSNISRSSSVSSLSSRKQDESTIETASTFSRPLEHEEHDEHESVEGVGSDDVKPAQPEFKKPENYWKQRSATLASNAPLKNNENEPPTVIENSQVVEMAAEPAKDYTSQDKITALSNEVEDTNKSEENFTKSDTRSEAKADDPKQWTTYSLATFDSSQQSSGSRFGNIGGGQCNDKYNNFNRDNRRERRDRDAGGERRSDRDGGDRRSDRYFKNRDDRNESSAFSGKWNHNRDRDGPFKSRSSEVGGSRRHDRDNNSGSFNNYRDRNENRFNKYSAFVSNRNSSRSDLESGRSRYEDERLINSEANVDTNSEMHLNAAEAKFNSRLKVNTVANAKPVENGNDNSVEGNETKGSIENISNDQSELNNSFKIPKKQKKKKIQESKEEFEQEAIKQNDGDRKLKNVKDEKHTDNHQNNDKVSSKNNNNKKKDYPKTSKKSREQVNDILQMPKQKEEKAPNFQDTNPFQFLKIEE